MPLLRLARKTPRARGITTPGSRRAVQICTASPRSTGVSSDPPLTETVPLAGSGACHNRLPQTGQKTQSSPVPRSVARDHVAGLPATSSSASAGTITEMPKAEADCFRHPGLPGPSGGLRRKTAPEKAPGLSIFWSGRGVTRCCRRSRPRRATGPRSAARRRAGRGAGAICARLRGHRRCGPRNRRWRAAFAGRPR